MRRLTAICAAAALGHVSKLFLGVNGSLKISLEVSRLRRRLIVRHDPQDLVVRKAALCPVDALRAGQQCRARYR